MKHSYILFSGVFVMALSFAGCSGNETAAGVEIKDHPVSVTLAKPFQSGGAGIDASGQVEAIHTALVSTRLMGRITRIYVKVGDKVQRGQVLATISGDDIIARKAQIDAQIAGAEADLSNAQKDLDRYKALFARQSATQSELDNVTLRYHAAQSRLEATRQMRKEADAQGAYARLTAPFNGVITQKLSEEGSLAMPGTPIISMDQNDGLRVSVTIPESAIARIKTGDKADITIKSTGYMTAGTVAQISVSSIATGGYVVKIAIPREAQTSLFSGMYATVHIPLKGSGNEGIWIPASALVERDQMTGIYTISNMHTALLRWVRTGKKAGDQVEILSGLNADEYFIAGSSGKLYNGVPVIENNAH